MGDVVDLSRARAARLLPAWRPMRPEDLPSVSSVSLACRGDDALVPRPERLAGCLVLESRGQVVGHLTMTVEGATAIVLDLCVIPEMRGRGLASLAVGMASSGSAAQGCDVIEVLATPCSDGFWSRACFTSVAGRGPDGNSRMVRLLPSRVARA